MKFRESLQSGHCPVQKSLPRKAELTWKVRRYLWRGWLNFNIRDFRPFFIIIFKSKILISRLEILVHPLCNKKSSVCSVKILTNLLWLLIEKLALPQSHFIAAGIVPNKKINEVSDHWNSTQTHAEKNSTHFWILSNECSINDFRKYYVLSL